MMTWGAIGYHGTTKEFGEAIIHTQRFNESKSEDCWLGDGIYFFEKDIHHAIYWCIGKNKWHAWKVIQGNISCPKELLVDLDDTQTFIAIGELANELRAKYGSVNVPRENRKKITMKLIMNTFYNDFQYAVARKSFRAHNHLKTIEIDGDGCSLYPTQEIICIRDHDCITTIKEVENNERSAKNS